MAASHWGEKNLPSARMPRGRANGAHPFEMIDARPRKRLYKTLPNIPGDSLRARWRCRRIWSLYPAHIWPTRAWMAPVNGIGFGRHTRSFAASFFASAFKGDADGGATLASVC
uniref:Uncharacterized protein n=1 Tax=Trichuris muris TaxID=70415 RepID=A0A5S6R5S8_TRIMR